MYFTAVSFDCFIISALFTVYKAVLRTKSSFSACPIKSRSFPSEISRLDKSIPKSIEQSVVLLECLCSEFLRYLVRALVKAEVRHEKSKRLDYVHATVNNKEAYTYFHYYHIYIYRKSDLVSPGINNQPSSR